MYSNTDESCGFTALWTACKQKVKLKSTFFFFGGSLMLAVCGCFRTLTIIHEYLVKST